MDLQNNVNELITLRTSGVEDAMKSMKDIESLFDRVTSNYRPLLNGERYLTTVPFLISSWVVRCCIVKVTWRLYCKDVITLLSVKRHRRRLSFRRIDPPKRETEERRIFWLLSEASVFLLFGGDYIPLPID